MQASDYTILATSERYRDVVAFWRRQLEDGGALAVLFPAPASPPSVTTERAARPRGTVPVPLGPRAVAALDALASDDIGRFTVLAAAVALAIARFGNHSRVLLQTPLLSTPFLDGDATENGAHLNDAGAVPLVFRAGDEREGGTDATIRSFLDAAAHVIEDSYTFQDFPVRALARRDVGLDLASAGAAMSCGAVHGAAPAPASALHFDVTVDASPRCRIDIDFDRGAVEPFVVDGLAAVIAETLDHFNTLSTRVRDLPRLPATQRAAVLTEWNRTTAPVPSTRVHELFEDRVRQHPDEVAVRFEGASISYAALNARANRIAHELMRATQPGGFRVAAIWMDRSPWMVAAVLGVLKAGMAYVPIDADTPAERLAFLVGDSGASLILASRSHATAASQLGCGVIVADEEIQGSAANPAVDVASSDLAYVIYTSGSTGRPKGCAIEHHSLTNYLEWANRFYWTSPDAGSMALFTPLSFDLTVPSLFCPLLRGRALTVFPQDISPLDALARQFTEDSGVDSIKLTPSHLRMLGGLAIGRTGVRLIIVGGEALTPEQVAIVRRVDPRIRLVNEYGPTEATVGCVATDVAAGGSIIIGRPIANTQAYVLAADRQPLAVGVRGELWIGGEGVARGYVGRPELDADRFLPNPFAAGGRMYRTGDIARWLPGGELECFGRVDDQIKVRGHRVEPGEVESLLRRQPGVREAVVVADADTLVAYVASDVAVDAGALRATLARSLPGYMVPSIIERIDELPLTPNGKVDRRRLPPPSAVRGAGPRVAPRTPTERAVLDIWSALFRREDIGVDDDFYALGGHSLRAMTLAQQVHQALGIELSIGDVLAHPTVARLAALLETRAPTERRGIPRVPDAATYPVSHGQRRLWLIDRIEEASPAYNVSSAFQLSGSLDRAALGRAFDALVARHESLRTVFVEVGDEPRQRVLPSLPAAVEFVDVRDDADRDDRVRALVARQASLPFDLATGPLFRAAVYQLDDDRSVLALTLHHIVSDAWSMRVLVADLVALYDRCRAGTEARLAPLPIQYRDYADWQRRIVDAGGLAEDEQYWRAKLGGALGVLDVPADFERPPAPSYRGRHLRAVIGAEASRRLRALAAAQGASTFMALVALVKTLLFRYSGQSDICIGSPIAGRQQADTAGLVGFFVNTLVLRDAVAGTDSFADILARVRRTAEDAYAHQALPFDRLVEQLDVARDLSRSPLFDVMVVHDVEPDGAPSGGGMSVQELRMDSGISKFDLTFAFAESADHIDVEIEFRTDLFLDSRIATMAAQLVELTGSVVAGPSTPIDRIAIRDLAAITDTAHRAVPPASDALREQAPMRTRVPVAPRDDRELLLVGVLETVLGRAGLGVTDHFFHAGGDSIKAIQVVNRLARRGWTLKVRDLFEAPVIADLARRLAPARASRAADGETGHDVDRPFPLTPIQRWFFETQPEDRSHFNQSVLLRFADRLDEDALRRTGRALTITHASLRLRFTGDGTNVLQSYAASAGAPAGPEATGYDPVDVHDLRAAADPGADLQRIAAAAQAGFDLTSGRLARLVLFRLPDADRLLAIVHHLAVDGVSWRILLEDLREGLAQVARGDVVDLAGSTDPYSAWARALEAHVPEVAAEESWWQDVDAARSVELPSDLAATNAGAPDAFESDARECRVSLGAEETAALLSRVHQAYNTRVQDVLLAALAGAARAWAGPGPVKIDLESHGRDALDAAAGVDVSRTVGWFTSLYPVVIDLGAEVDPGRRLVTVKDTLRRTPGHGAGYGLLRRGRSSGAAVLFNFLGQFDADTAGLELADEDRGPELGPRVRMTHALVIGGWISDGRLHITARFSPRRFTEHAIERFLETYRVALDELIAHCAGRATRERTLSDLRYADPTAAALFARLGADRVEDMYPLLPMQLGMLYHAALAASGSGSSSLYVETFTYAIGGPLDVTIFRRAWETVIARHAALRTAFYWRDVAQPVQVVFAHVDVPWTVLDWRALDPEQQNARLAALSAEERRRGLALDAAPLLRFALVRLADESFRVYWTVHHLVLDGWSTAVVVREVMSEYQSIVAGAAPDRRPVRPFGDYIDWVRAQDTAAADGYWRSRLHDFSTPTPLPAAIAPASEPGALATAERHLSQDATAALERSARTLGLTLNTFARAAWAILLAAHAGRADCVFGATVAGRPADLPDVETMVGLFINTLPIRVHVNPSDTIGAWLHRLQAEQASLDLYAFSSLADIQRVSGVPPRTALFDSVLVFENYPVDHPADDASAVSVDELPAIEETNYPLTVIVAPGERLLLRLSYDTSRYDQAAADALLRRIESTLVSMGDDPSQPVAALLGRPVAIAGNADGHASSHPDVAQARQQRIASRTWRLDPVTLESLHAIAAHLDTALPSVAEGLVAVLAFRYAANEDLRCVLGSRVLARHALSADDDFAASCRAMTATPPDDGSPASADPADLRFIVRHASGGAASFDGASPNAIVIDVASETGRFDGEFIDRAESHFRTLAASVEVGRTTAIGRLALVPPDEETRLVEEFNATTRDWSTSRTIVQCFEEQAAAHPDRCAVRLPHADANGRAVDAAWTYAELNARANQLARRLVRDHAVGPDVRVGVLAERSFEMVMALMAVEKAGGAYVPLDPDYPRELLQFMIDDCGAAVILTEDRFAGLAAGHAAPVIAMNHVAAQLALENADNLPLRASGTDLAYVIYTSGSTGRPKGAMNTHAAIANRLFWMQDAYALTAEDRVLQKTPFSFDVSVWEFFWPLMTGAELVLARPGGHRDAAYLVELITAARITTVHFVPSMLQAFIEEPGVERCTSLKRVICSGEAVTPELLRRYLAKLAVPLHNLYGPTEAAVDVTAWPLTAADAASAVPIGKPIANIRIYILDERLQPVPIGVTGELFIGGVGVGRGYLNRDDLTAAKFIPDPFSVSSAARLYRTGDLARFRDDGVIDFLGRIDHQVKLRGFRIELGEIESALLDHPAVRECVVVVREDQPGMKRLVAYVVLTGSGSGTADLTAHLRARLASHMVPAGIVPLDALPRLTNGKLDRKALPIPEQQRDGARAHVAPRDAVERRLVRVWEDVLGHANVGVTDDFFESGGHSILALKLVSAIQLEFGRSLPLAQLLSHPTIERLAVALKMDGGASLQDWRPLVNLRRGDEAPPLFLLPGAGGNVIYFHALARLLTTSRPVYGLQAIGLDGRTPPLQTVDAIAAANIREMRRACPAGPYFIAGHSFGGRVALEIAQQLLRDGQSVQFLGVLDTPAPKFEPAAVGADWTDAHWLAKIAREIEEFFGVRLGVTLDALAGRPLAEQLQLVIDRMQDAGVWAPGADPAQLRGYLQVYKAHTQAAFVPYGTSAGRAPVALFKARDRDEDLDATPAGLALLQTHSDWGWQQFSDGPVQVFDVPGSHLSMLTDPHVGALARAIDAALAAAERSS